MLSMNIERADPNSIKKAADLLRSGKLVAFATETVYGLGGDATNDKAIAEIFATKARPEFNPLIVHVSDAQMAKCFVEWNARAEKLALAFWPGPLTLVLKRTSDCKVSLLASAGGDTLAIRVPANKAAHALLVDAGIPVAAPSANRSGRVSPTTAEHVYAEFGDRLPLILDGGACDVGIESTVVDVSGDEVFLLRPGTITREQLEEVLGGKLSTPDEKTGVLKSPGMLLSHYAPSLPVRLNAVDAREGEALLGFGKNAPHNTVINLSLSGDLKEAAANLFAALRFVDKPELYSAISITPIPDTGIGIAINDRLKRASQT